MKILNDLISTLNLKAEVGEICLGPFQTAVFTRNCGLASTPHEHASHQDHPPVKNAGRLLEIGIEKLVNMVYSSSSMEAAIGMATINSLLEIDEHRCFELNAADLLAEKGKNKRIALIGHFPFVSRLRQLAKELWVIERQPQKEDFEETEAEKFVPQAEVVGITGTTFINHTIEHLLSLCRSDAYVIVLGGTTPLSPVLFNYGVAAISGTKVVNPELVLRYVSQGATFRQLKGIRLLTMMK